MNSNRAHLVPTPTTNKNGVRTTVYRKPATGTASSTRFPKATLPVNGKPRKELERETAHLLAHLNLGEPKNQTEAVNREQDYQKLLTALPRYSDETLHRLISTPRELGWTAAGELGVMLRGFPSEAHVNDWFTLRPVFSPSRNIDRIEHLIDSLNEYRNLTPQTNGSYPIERTGQAQAVSRVTQHFITAGDGFNEDINRNGNLIQTIADEGLSDLLTTHEDPAAIADIIIDRNLTDPEQITALYETMTTTENAISEGTL